MHILYIFQNFNWANDLTYCLCLIKINKEVVLLLRTGARDIEICKYMNLLQTHKWLSCRQVKFFNQEKEPMMSYNWFFLFSEWRSLLDGKTASNMSQKCVQDCKFSSQFLDVLIRHGHSLNTNSEFINSNSELAYRL